jgi:uncharacterized membrane protein
MNRMNRAQRGAWLGFFGGVFTIILLGMLGYAIKTGFQPQTVHFMRWIVVPYVGYAIYFVYAYNKKRYANEPEADERDRQISHTAARICLVSLCLLIYVSDVVILFVSGLEGQIYSVALPVIHFVAGYIALTIYYAAILVMYRKDNKMVEGFGSGNR